VVAQATVNFAGGDALLGFSGSAWSQAPGEISLEVWLDGQPVGGPLSIYANQGGMHMALGRTWVWCPGVAPGEHKIAVMAGLTTITDGNDRVSLTLWNLADAMTVRTAVDEPCPTGVGQKLVDERFATHGGRFLVSSSASGWVTAANGFVSNYVVFSAPTVVAKVFANNANQHLATVPIDFVLGPWSRGQNEVQLLAQANTSTDSGDYAHLSIVEWTGPGAGPVVVPTNPGLGNVTASGQQGGGVIAAAQFQSSGGPLLFRLNCSAWSPNVNDLLGISVQLDNQPVGRMELFTNVSGTHLTVVSNDLVLNVPAGAHKLVLMGDVYTYTDANDLVSVLIMEFPKT
jgi:hypothetical protein